MWENCVFDGFAFDSSSGELKPFEQNSNAQVTRLQPQPARLLQLLIESYPEVLTHEEIKTAIWPEVHVNFDNSMHYCIRQIRSALHDDPAEPKYIETITRRGYRWLVPAETTNKEDESINETATLAGPLKKRPWAIVALCIALVVFGVVAVWFYQSQDSTTETNAHTKIRLAIMPLQPQSTTHPFFQNGVALQVLEQVTMQSKEEFDAIGPSTTGAFDPYDFWQDMEQRDVEWVINSRFPHKEREGQLLVELVRLSDGAHIWVHYFNLSEGEEAISKTVTEGLKEQHTLKETLLSGKKP